MRLCHELFRRVAWDLRSFFGRFFTFLITTAKKSFYTTRVDEGMKGSSFLAIKIKARTVRCGEGGEEPSMWPRIWVTTRRGKRRVERMNEMKNKQFPSKTSTKTQATERTKWYFAIVNNRIAPPTFWEANYLGLLVGGKLLGTSCWRQNYLGLAVRGKLLGTRSWRETTWDY